MRIEKEWTVLTSLALVLACGSDRTGPPLSRGSSGTVITTSEIEPGVDCPKGGHLIRRGLDIDQDGELADDEIEETIQICNGVDGVRSLVTVEDAGSACPAGGHRVLVGVDADGDGTLTEGEIESSSLICQGEKGDDGRDGADACAPLIRVSPLADDESCEAGGYLIETGADLREGESELCDGLLSEGEVQTTAVACHGEPGQQGGDGHDALLDIQPLPPGESCPQGGLTIHYGTDGNGNATLEAEERAGTTSLCSETCGAYECGGTCGACDPSVADSCNAGFCGCGEGPACTDGDVCREGACAPPPGLACSANVGNTSVAAVRDFAVADINQDGLLDILSSTGNALIYATRNANGTYTTAQSIPIEREVYGVALGDVDGDGDLDLVTAGPNGDTASLNAVFINNAGTFEPGTTMVTSHNSAFYGMSVLARDINGDGVDDVVWITPSNIRVALGPYDADQKAFPAAPVSFAFAKGGNSSSSVILDLDSDGDLDLVVGNDIYTKTNDGALSIFLNDGSGGFSLVSFTAGNTPLFSGDYLNPFALAAGDINHDGALDLVFWNYSEGFERPIVALRTSADGQTPTYAFSAPTIDGMTGFSMGTAVGDFDDDGVTDLFTGPLNDARFLKGHGDGSFTASECVAGSVSKPRVIDMNDDGVPDLVYIASGSVRIRYAD